MNTFELFLFLILLHSETWDRSLISTSKRNPSSSTPVEGPLQIQCTSVISSHSSSQSTPSTEFDSIDFSFIFKLFFRFKFVVINFKFFLRNQDCENVKANFVIFQFAFELFQHFVHSISSHFNQIRLT